MDLNPTMPGIDPNKPQVPNTAPKQAAPSGFDPLGQGAIPGWRNAPGGEMSVLEEMFRKFRLPQMSQTLIRSILPQLLQRHMNEMMNMKNRGPVWNMPSGRPGGVAGTLSRPDLPGFGSTPTSAPLGEPLTFEEWINQMGPSQLLTQAVGMTRKPMGGGNYLNQVLNQGLMGATRKRAF